MSKQCPRCDGGGRVPLSASEQAIFGRLSFEVPTLTDALATAVGLSRQRVDGVLLTLEREGLARRLPRTADGYEWLAASPGARHDVPDLDVERLARRLRNAFPDLTPHGGTTDAWFVEYATNLVTPLPTADDVRGILAAPQAADDGDGVLERGDLAPHSGEWHDFRTTCTRCGDLGMVNLAIFGPDEVVEVRKRATEATDAREG